MQVNSASELINLVEAQYTNGRFILGLDGLSRSGKSTLASNLSERLKQNRKEVITIHIDDHITERKVRYDTGFDAWYEYYFLQWDAASLQENLFSKLREEKEITLPFYHSEADKTEIKTMAIPQACIIIMEGVFLQREQWRSFFDLLVYLDCPREKRFARESSDTREKIDKFKLRYWKAEDYYLDNIHPLASADVIMKA